METREKKNRRIHQRIKNEKRKKRQQRMHKCLIFLLILTIGVALYARFIGTAFLNVNEYTIKDNKLPDNFYGFKIVHFTDLHYGSTIYKKELNNVQKTINEIKPDLIVFTGDLTNNNYELSDDDINNLISFMNDLKATVGKYLIKGNNDYNKTYDKIISQTDFIILDNSYDLIYYKGHTPILLTGTASMLKKKTDLDKSFSYLKDNNLFTISLIHEPDLFDELTNKPINLVLAGHSHLGQVRLPFVGSLYDVKGSLKYNNHYYNINNSRMYVSGGIGTSFLKFRLFNHPSINLYRLTK
jgi:uncharacterized protein